MKPSVEVLGGTLYFYTLFISLGVVVCGALLCALTFVRHRKCLRENFFALGMFVVALMASVPSAMFFDALFHLGERGAFVFRGATFYGGMVGGVAVWSLLLLVWRKPQVRLYDRLSDLMPAIALGHAIGRIGCFMGGCCYGAPTDSVFGVVFPEGSGAYEQFGAVAVHPTQLYDAFVCLAVFAILLIFGKKNGFPLYLMLYGAGRFVVEFFRADDRGSLFGLPLSPGQIVSIVLILFGEILWLVRLLAERKRLRSQ